MSAHSTAHPFLPREVLAGLRERLNDVDYRVDAANERIGAAGQRGLGRNTTMAAAAELGDAEDPVSVLTRLWVLQQPVRAGLVEQALPGLAAELSDGGLLRAAPDGQLTAAVDVRPYASDSAELGWVVSDLTPGLDAAASPQPSKARTDHVLGVSSASTTLAQLTIAEHVERALDLGTGSGVQTLHLQAHARRIVATDLNPRALALARLTAGLSGVEADFREGDLYEPVVDETFELIITNPPYVMSPPAGPRLTYRESNLPGDELVATVVRGGARRLAENGTLQVLGNWAHTAGQDWQDRLAGWIAPTGCDALVVQREVLDVFEYIEIWLADAGLVGSPRYAQRYREWLDYFSALGVTAIGMGWINLRRAGRQRPAVRIEAWPHAVAQPVGGAIDRYFHEVAAAEWDVAQVLDSRWRLAPDVSQETIGEPGAEDPEHIVLRQLTGLRRAMRVDTATAAVLGASDGELTLGQLVGAVAHLTEQPGNELAARFGELVPGWAAEGYLVRESSRGDGMPPGRPGTAVGQCTDEESVSRPGLR